MDVSARRPNAKVWDPETKSDPVTCSDQDQDVFSSLRTLEIKDSVFFSLNVSVLMTFSSDQLHVVSLAF